MSVSAPVPLDHPLMIAWEALKATEDFANTKRWTIAGVVNGDTELIHGQLWAIFVAGWEARGASNSSGNAA